MNEEKKEQDIKAPRKKKIKIAYGIIFFVALVIIGVASYGLFSMIHSSDEKVSTKTVKELDSELDNFFVKDSTIFIATSADSKNLEIVKTKIDDLSQSDKKTELLSKYNDIKTRMTDIKEVNELFEKPVIKGAKVSDDSILKEAKPVTLMKFSNNDALYDILDSKIDEAKEQYKQIKLVQDQLDEIYKDDQLLTTNISKDDLDNLRTDAGKIKNETIRKKIETTIDTIQNLLSGGGSSTSSSSYSTGSSISSSKNSSSSQIKESSKQSTTIEESSTFSSSSITEEPSSSSSSEVPTNSDEVVVGEYNGVVYKGLGNSNRIFNTKEEAELFAKNEGSANQKVEYDIWQVRLKADNSIKWTVNIIFGT